DLVLAGPKGLRILRGLGERWVDVSQTAVPASLLAPKPAGVPVAFASADLDGNGALDLAVVTAAGFKILRNDGGEKNGSVRIVLAGKHSNRGGVGSKVEARAGSLRVRL